MINVFWISLVLLLLRNIHSSIGKCTFSHDQETREDPTVECISVDESEVMSFMIDRNFNQLIIKNSYIPHVELFSNENFTSLIIRNSSVETFLPNAFHDLKLLDLSFNVLSKVHFLKATTVPEIVLHHNNIEILDGSNLNYDIKRLDTSHNRIKDITNLRSTGLISLNLSHNRLESLSGVFDRPSSLNFLDLSFNKLKTVSVEDTGFLNNIKCLNLSHNNIKSFDIANRVWYEVRELNGSFPFHLDLSFNEMFTKDPLARDWLSYSWTNKISEAITNLDLSNTGIVKLINNTFDQLFHLKTLNLDQNSIKMVPTNFFGFNTELTTLSMVRNPISTISNDSFSHKMKLKHLYMTLYGAIPKRIFQNLIFLEELHFQHSSVTKINGDSFKGLVNLKILNFMNSTVEYIEPGAFSGLSRVKYFDERNIFKNISKLESGVFVGLEALQSLNFSSIGIEVIEDHAFSGLQSLLSLTLSQNKILKLPPDAFVELKNLEILDLSYNELGEDSLTNMTFRNLIELRGLHLQHNKINKLGMGVFSKLGKLKVLNLSHNQIFHHYTDENSLSPLKNLEILDINSNGAYSPIDEVGLSSLKTIGFGGNKWRCLYVFQLLHLFEQYGVEYRNISILDFKNKNVRGIACKQSIINRELFVPLFCCFQ